MRPNRDVMPPPRREPPDEARIDEIERAIGRKLSGDVKIARFRPKRDDK